MYIKVYNPDKTLNFMNDFNKEVEGLIHEVIVDINKYQTKVIYVVWYEGKLINIDGELFRIIK